ncbi:OprO/OprP family phosphate-selective porin [Marinoscillum sp. MHG1-6]|uniref:OprO/OprP family phosphate-selective porin n=1 Tax=Marinoscillum sp. MHG1-6 TaxID=2959627 RepID=UPI0021586840|nr:OprO/OprP family phosphate-selective porin [Marinoscillum sp. MHG1-6]
MKKLLLTLFALATTSFITLAQEGPTFYAGLQIWMRYTDLNPGSAIGTEESDEALDFSIRRYRLGVKGNPYDYLSYNIQIGHNNLSRYAKDQPPKLLDAYVSYHYFPNHSVTVGKHAWTGLSRYAAPSTFAAVGADINYAATIALNLHDDFFRRLGVALHGDINDLNYRLVFSKPFSYKAPPLSNYAQFSDQPTSLNVSGYFKYQFLDHESQSSAFSPWTYHGKKELFNIGAGWTYQHEATQSLSTLNDTVIHAMKSFAVDVYYERPSGKLVWTSYLSFLNHHLGKEFIRYIGANNPSNGVVNTLSLNGKGNSFPEAGSGQIILFQLAALKQLTKNAIQPNLMIEYARFKALDDPMVLFEGGVNYILDGHKSKISLGYQNRPVFTDDGTGAKESDRRHMVVLQYQLRI